MLLFLYQETMRAPGNPDFGPRRNPGGRIIPPNSDQDPIPNPHQIVEGGQTCNRIRDPEGGNGQDVVNQGRFRTGQEGYPGLALQDEQLLLLKIPPQNIQEGDNTKEYQ